MPSVLRASPTSPRLRTPPRSSGASSGPASSGAASSSRPLTASCAALSRGSSPTSPNRPTARWKEAVRAPAALAAALVSRERRERSLGRSEIGESAGEALHGPLRVLLHGVTHRPCVDACHRAPLNEERLTGERALCRRQVGDQR